MEKIFSNHTYQTEEQMCKRIRKNEVVYIIWSPTNACFLECPYCFGHSQQITEKEKNIPVDIWKRLNKLTRGKEMCLKISGGGEPFFNESFRNVLHLLPSTFCWVIDTNGLLLHNVKWPKQINPNSILNITCHYKSMQKKKLLDRWLENIHITVKNVPVMISVIAYPPGLGKEFDTSLSFAKKTGCPIHIRPLVGGENLLLDWSRIWPTAQHRKWYILYKEKNSTWKGQYCLAGENIFTIKNGDIYSCTTSSIKIGELYPDFILPSLKNSICPFEICSCTLQGFYGTNQE